MRARRGEGLRFRENYLQPQAEEYGHIDEPLSPSPPFKSCRENCCEGG